MRCNNCGNMNPEGAAFCTACGAPLQQRQVKFFCTACGNEIEPDAVFCPVCGVKRNAQQENSAPRAMYEAPAPRRVDESILTVAANRRLVTAILTLVLSLLQIAWPFVTLYSGIESAYYYLTYDEASIILILLMIPAFTFFLINFIAGLRSIVVSRRILSRPVGLLKGSSSGGSIMLIIFYSIILIVSLIAADVIGCAVYLLGIVVCGLKLGLDIKYIRAHKEELTIIEENYKLSQG